MVHLEAQSALERAIKVILTLDPANYPLGFKDVLLAGDLPVVWTNTNYNMLYLNMGHGDKIFTDPNQNLLLQNAFLSMIKHIVVLMLENRSFDHLLGWLQSDQYQIDGLDGSQSNRDSTGKPVKVTDDANFSRHSHLLRSS